MQEKRKNRDAKPNVLARNYYPIMKGYSFIDRVIPI